MHCALVIHVGHLPVIVETEVGTGHDVADLEEVQAFQPDWRHLLLVTNEMELVEVFSLLVYLDPSVEGKVREYLILGLQTKLVTKFTA